TLTDAGLKIARRTYNRHKLLTEFLKEFGIDPSTAEADACKIEHDISDETYEKIKAHVKKKV
ncbi:MAG TPA: iron dependent repressor, metal binding and dimerization domain protein, partial [Lachnospiraceae bacterium]|nr:iron dependent repressor, metal binding and dimerization domain protein [Lachnospiraceae bacterium]